MGTPKPRNLRSELTVSIVTAVIASFLTAIVVYTQIGSEQKFAEAQRKLSLQEKNLSVKIDNSKKAASLLAESSVRRYISALNYFASQLAFSMSEAGRKDYNATFSEYNSRYYKEKLELFSKLAELRSVLLEANYFFGADVQKAIKTFTDFYEKEPSAQGLSREAIEKTLDGVRKKTITERRAITKLYALLVQSLENDEFRKLGTAMLAAMYSEIANEINEGVKQ